MLGSHLRPRLRGLTLLLAIALLAALAPAAPAYAGTTVSSLADDNSIGTLRQVIGFVSPGQTITFAPGLSGTIVLTQGSLLIDKSITISGPGPLTLAVSGNNASRVFHITAGNQVMISGLTIRDGRAASAAGVGNHGDLRLEEVVVTNNTATSGFGGGIYNADDAIGLVLEGSTVSANRAPGGGGIFNQSVLSISGGSIIGNDGSGGYGGGLLSRSGGSVTINNTAVISNSTDLGGGGIYNGTGSELSITGGEIRLNSAAGTGGALGNQGQATLTNVKLEDNTADGGGGIYHFAAGTRTALDGVTLRSNRSIGDGGAISAKDAGSLTVVGSTIELNEAPAGGGIFTLGISAWLTRTVLFGNSATTTGGGGIFANGGSVSLFESELRDNSAATNGGAIRASGAFRLRSSLLAGNEAAGSGGGIFAADGTLAVESSTLSANRHTAPNSGGGGGLLVFGGATTINNSTIVGNGSDFNAAGGGVELAGGSLALANTILADNNSRDFPNCKGAVQSLGHNLVGNSQGCGFGAGSGDLVGDASNPVDPRLAPLADNGGPTHTHALLAGGPAIDAGNPAGSGAGACLATDQRGVSRPQGSQCDIGAYEGGAAGGASALRFVAQPANTLAGGPLSLTVEAIDSNGSRVTSYNGQGTLALAPGSPPGSQLNGTLGRSFANGVAVFNGLSINQTGGYQLLVTSGGLSATSAAFQILPGPASRLLFIAQPPALATAGLPFAGPVRVALADAFGNRVTSVSSAVTVALEAPGGPAGARLLGATTAILTNGVASFDSLSVDRAGAGFTLRASMASPPLSASSVAFAVAPLVRVTRVGRADTSGGLVEQLDELSGTTSAINRLVLEFSAPMGPSAGAAASYRLISAGGDGRIETVDCAGPQGDDLALAINSASYIEATRRARLGVNGGAPLPPGSYRLIACPSLADVGGVPLDGDGDGVAGDAFTRTFDVLSAAPPPWLVLIYMAGEDAGAGLSVGLAEDMALALNRLRPNPAARIVALYDGRGSGDTRLYTFSGASRVDITESAAASPEWTGGFGGAPGSRELNTGSALSLQNFIRWAKSSYPGARHTFLAVVDHGGGWAPDLGPGAQPGGIGRVLAGGWRGLSLDVRGASSLSTRDTGAVFGPPGAATHVDLLFYDACLMGMLEVAYEVRAGADYLVAGENLLFASFPYEDYLAPEGLTAATTPRQLAERLVARYNRASFGAEPFTIAAVDLARLRGDPGETVAGRLDSLARLLLAGLPPAPVPPSNPLRAALTAAYAASQKFDYDSSLSIDPRDGYVDLADFAQELDASPSAAVTAEVRAAARALRAALLSGDGRVVIAQRTVGGEYNGQAWDLAGATGLAIFLPLGEQDWRPTRINPDPGGGRAVLPEDQLAYYAQPGQLALTRDAPAWAALLLRLQPNTPIRAPGGLPAPAQSEEVITTPFRAPAPLQLRDRLFLPVMLR